MNAQIKLTREAFRIDAQDWCSDIADRIEEKFAESNRDGIVVTISGGLDSSRNCGPLGMDEQPVNKLQEAVRLSATSRNHALAPILSYCVALRLIHFRSCRMSKMFVILRTTEELVLFRSNYLSS